MALRSRARIPVAGAPMRLRIGLIVLLLASTLLNFLVSDVVRAATERLPVVLDPQLVGAVVYATLGAAALAAVFVAGRRSGRFATDFERPELVQLGGALGLVLLLGTYWLHGVVSLPAVPRDILAPLLTAAGAMAAPALVYARFEGIDLPLGEPDRNLAVETALAAALVAAGWLAVSAAVFDPSPVFPGGRFGSPITATSLVWQAVYPGALVGVGMGILYHGAVQAALREYAGPAGAVAAIPALIGTTMWASGEVLSGGDLAARIAAASVVAMVSLIAALVAASAGHWLLGGRSIDDARTAVVATATGLTVVALPMVALAPVRGYPPRFVAWVAAFALVAAVAAVGYERGRSIWLPALAFAVYLTLADWQFVALLA